MYRSTILAALTSLAMSWAAPQLINLDEVDAAPDPVLVTPPLDVQQNTPTPVAPASVTPFVTPGTKRDLGVKKRDGSCAQQPPGSGPVPNPDTASAFAADPDYTASATNAPTPDGYVEVFSNLNGSLSASNYMGLHTITSFDTLGCASQCDQASGCQAFNVYIERDPSVDPNAQNCPNPPSTINYKCTLWGAPVAAGEATNYGQWRDSFQVLIAGSNAYNKNAPPPAINGYSGPTELGGAINAPLDAQGHNTYMGDKYFPFSQSQGYDPQTCANACDAQTLYDSQHPASDGTYQSCIFFNAYVLSENAIPQGLYCSFYNETWAPSYATNYGQYRGSDRYTVSRSYSYSLTNPTNTSAPPPCPTGPAIQNGGFENFPDEYNVAPPYWNVTDVVGYVFYGPDLGSTMNGGLYSFDVDIYGATLYQPILPRSGLNLSQPLSVCAATSYTLSFQYFFGSATDCNFVVEYPSGPSTGSVTYQPASATSYDQWFQSKPIVFQTGPPPYVLSFIVSCFNGAIDSGIAFDNVEVSRT